MTDQPPQSRTVQRRWIVMAAAVLVLALGGAVAAGIYGIGPFQRNAAEASCRPAVELARRIAPLVHGEVAALNVAEAPLQVPDLAFRDAAGNERHLAEWRGRTVLFNLWATWCIPCRKEMPALAALQGTLGGPDFEVVAVNIDTRDLEKPRSWLKDIGIANLGYFADPSAKVFQELKLLGKAFGMPTTLLIDGSGCEIGTIAGPAEWASDDGLALIRAALAR